MLIGYPTIMKTFQDANEAVAAVAYQMSETIAIYPITPSSPMAELTDEWAAMEKPNLWGIVPEVTQMQSEAGVAGALHGALTGGALATTFTASQGLLLMIPNMYKIAGELTPFCMHVTARTLATHALSIFGDHSDVMACRQTGFALLASNSPQEAQDLAAIAHAATLETRIPFLHFFDGFRTSHEINVVDQVDAAVLRGLLSEKAVLADRERGLDPEKPSIRGTAQNPDVFFQAREAANPFYHDAPQIIQAVMDRFGAATGRNYHLFDYSGAESPEQLVIAMGSGAETLEQTCLQLNARGERFGVLKVRLLRPFSLAAFCAAIPASVKAIAVLDRCKEPGSAGEPLYQEILTGLHEGRAGGLLSADFHPLVVSGRFGLGSKEFNPAMARAVFDNLKEPQPRNHFTVGINDDLSRSSLKWDESFHLDDKDTLGAVFYGLGSDGTVGANKNTIKIIGSEGRQVQAYFVYDSKKSGAMTVSHLRFGPRPIHAPYLVESADFVGCHQWQFVNQYALLERAREGAIFLLNSPFPPDRVWQKLPDELRSTIREKRITLYVIDAYKVATEASMGGRINTIMQTCFFAVSGVMKADQAVNKIKQAIAKTYARKGELVVQRNCEAVDRTLSQLHKVDIPDSDTDALPMPPAVPAEAPDFVRDLTAVLLRGEGDQLPVSVFTPDGTWPCGTSQWERRNLAREVPVWDPDICIQCGKCALVCPHASIRAKRYDSGLTADAPATFQSVPFRSRDIKGQSFTIQVAPEDCTGCELCVVACPAKNKANPRRKAINMTPRESVLEAEKANWAFFQTLPRPDPATLGITVKESQLLDPLFEFSGACSGCGETPYIKLLTQLFGDRLMIANATGCSSIYGGNLPTTPYTTDSHGRGPAWSNSLFEDNAEFALGMRLAADKKGAMARVLLPAFAPILGDTLVGELLQPVLSDPAGVAKRREAVAALREGLSGDNSDAARMLLSLSGFLIRKSVWAVGGDGWAYDIGFGGLDHLFSSGRDVNVLVLDTEVYSNTGGQSSKATPLSAVAKFSAAGKPSPKKDLAMSAMLYGHVYVASIAMGAKDGQTVQALAEAEAWPGTSLVIAYSHCIAHGYHMKHGLEQQKKAVQSGHWPLFRYDPSKAVDGGNPLRMDAPEPRISFKDYAEQEMRFRMLMQSHPDRANALTKAAQEYVDKRSANYRMLAASRIEPKTDATYD